MNLKKIKIIYILPNKLIIFSFTFFVILFFQIESVNAACNWTDKGTVPFEKTCNQLGLTDGTCTGAQPTNNICCCRPDQPSTPAPTADMPKLKIPELQISIPGLTFTKSEDIKCTEEGGKKTCNIPWIGEYIAGVYKYAIGIVGILAAVVLMIGGVMWIVAGGSATMIGEAKAWIGASLTGLVIALCSYLILYQVNPALVKFGGLGIQIVDQIPIPADLKAFAEKCKPTDSGECAVSKMSLFGTRDKEASAICMAESSGVANAKNTLTKCSNGDYYAVWGLFQFNLSSNKFFDGSTTLNCPAAFGNKAWVNSSPNCAITDPALYQQCVTAASNPDLSRINAQKLVTTNSWGPWEANSKWCKF